MRSAVDYPTSSPSPVGATPLPEKWSILRAVLGIAVYAAAFGVTFGAVAISAGLSVPQTVLMSAVMCTGASQFAFVGVLTTGGAPLAGAFTALLLGLRNAFYGVPLSRILDPRGLRRLLAAQMVIDETTAMAVGQARPAAARYAFWVTAGALYCCWTGGTFVGAVIGGGINTGRLGLDAAAPVIFLALLWPQLRRRSALAVAMGAAVVSLALVPITPAGVPIIAAVLVAVVAGTWGGEGSADPGGER